MTATPDDVMDSIGQVIAAHHGLWEDAFERLLGAIGPRVSRQHRAMAEEVLRDLDFSLSELAKWLVGARARLAAMPDKENDNGY